MSLSLPPQKLTEVNRAHSGIDKPADFLVTVWSSGKQNTDPAERLAIW